MAWYDNWLKNSIKGEIDQLLKADGGNPAPVPEKLVSGDTLPDVAETHHDASKQIGRKSFVDDPYYDNLGNQSNHKQKASRITNRTLRDVSLRDWLVSAIMQCRADTALRFARPEHRRFEMGFRVVKKDDKSEYTPEDLQKIAAIEDFIYNCGRKEGTPASERMLFTEFMKLIARDALTFGHVAIEKVKTRGGGLHRIRPLPAESVYLINKTKSRDQIEGESKQAEQSYKKPKSDNDPSLDQTVTEVPIDYYKYTQVTQDGRTFANFGDEDLIFKLFNPQNFADLNGYCYGPLELAILNVTNHLNVENYNANFFTQGYAARGILHLKGTVTQAQLANFRRQFYNSITGSQHAWRTPIVAGLDEVQWVPMSGSAREMEYINFNNHIMRIICAQFQIDPVELGLDYLISANGRAPMQQANNEYKIVYSRERGLLPLLMFVEDFVNSDIIPAIDKDLSDKYKFIFTGYTDETPQTEIAQMQAEMTVYKSMNDLLIQSQKNKIDTPAANLPLNQAFWALVEKNYTRGEIREQFFGDKGASKKRELQYIPGDQAFLAWQQTILAIDNAKEQKKQMAQQMTAEQQAAQQDAEREAQAHEREHRHAEAGHKRDEEAHAMEMEKQKAEAAANVVSHGNPLHDAAKQFGASKATNIGGAVMANPINKLDE
jgi:hypothetical protein